MTHIIKHFGMATTAIAAVLALSATPSFAQETGTPPDPVADTSVQTPTSADPLAPEPVAEDSPVAADTPIPPAAKPKIEPRSAASQHVKSSASRPAAPSTVRRVSATAPAATAAPAAVEAAGPAPLPAQPQPQPPAAAEPAAPLIAEPVTASDTSDGLMSDFMAEPMLPVAGAAALGLIALGGAGIVMKRRRRRLEDEEFEARQRALAMMEAESTPELDPAAEVHPGPAFARTPAPVHDRVPLKANWESRPDADFLFRRADKAMVPEETN